jgi:hypothetical protein
MTELEDISGGAFVGGHRPSDMMFLMPRLTTTFDVLMIDNASDSPAFSGKAFKRNKKAVVSLIQVDWARLASMRHQQLTSSAASTAFMAKLVTVPTSPNRAHRLVLHLLSLLPHWKKNVTMPPANAHTPPLDRSPRLAPSASPVAVAKKVAGADTKGIHFVQLCRITGFITKQGSYMPTWKRRFFVLENRELRYYKNREVFEAREDPLGIFEIEVDDTCCERQVQLVSLKSCCIPYV